MKKYVYSSLIPLSLLLYIFYGVYLYRLPPDFCGWNGKVFP